MKHSELRESASKGHEDKLDRMLGKADRFAEKAVEKHDKTAPHLSKEKVAKIADKEIAVKGEKSKPRADRAARKKGGRTKGDVNIIIAQKPDQPQGAPMGGAAPMMPPPRPPVMMAPPPQGGMPPQGPPPGMGAPPPGAMPMAGAPPSMPPGVPQRKKGGKVELDGGAGGALGRLEKAAEYGARK